MLHYIQLLGSDTPNGYGGCCYYGPLDHPALHASTLSSATGSGPPTGGVPPASRHSYVVDAEATVPAPTLVPSVNASAHETLHQFSPTGEVAEPAVPSSWNWSSYLTAKRPTWPRAGPFHTAKLLHPQPPSPSVSPSAVATASTPHVTADTGFSGSEGYIFFNCPEGTQRFSSEANIKLKKVRGFFFTRWSSSKTAVYPLPSGNVASSVEDEQHGSASADAVDAPADTTALEMPVGAASAVMGLPGMLFTINDAGARHATFFGPSAALDDPPQPAHMEGVARAGTRNGDGGSEPHNSNSEQAYAHACGSPCAGDSAATSSTGGSAVAAPGAQLPSPLSSAGLRGFLTALRFHYFQYRPMVFRQLHGLVRHAMDQAAVSGHSVDATSAAAIAGNNQLHFVETVGEPTASRGAQPGRPLTGLSPFIHATLPLSPQSLLVTFRVSGGRRGGESESAATAAAAAGDARMSLLQPTSPSAMPEDEQQRHQLRHAYFAGHIERADQRADTDTAGSTMSFTAPTSHDVVFGYAIIVAPGPSFDAAKARALGVRSGPKYGQLKLGMSVQADTDAGVADTSAASMPPSQNATVAFGHTNDQLPTPTQRWVHPHQVMRPTAATRHAYISLVLDGDRPEDVREAVARLLGSSVGGDGESPSRSSAAACREAEEDDNTCCNAAVGEHSDGVLQRLLREYFPHLAYYYEEDDKVGEGTAAAPPHSQEPRLRRRPRQLAVRHVVHVQPTSYFAQFERRCRHNALLHSPFVREDRAQARPKTLPPSLHREAGAPGVYAAYNAYIFADVAGQHDPLHHQRVCAAADHGEEEAVAARVEAGGDAVVVKNVSSPPRQDSSKSLSAVQLSLAPSLSFTLDDMADTADELPRYKTWQLFTSYVQRHFTAFPTALVHRYHLHHLAPSLFPIVGATALTQRAGGAGNATEDRAARSGTAAGAAISTEASSSGSAVRAQRAKPSVSNSSSSSAEDVVEYWPYSLKLRCIPEATLQLPYKQHATAKKATQAQQGAEMAGPVRQAPSTVNASLGHDAATAAAHRLAPCMLVLPLRQQMQQLQECYHQQQQLALGLLQHHRAELLSWMDRVDRHGGFAASQQRVDVPSTGMGCMGGGALGFLGTGSAVPSKYRNVSGTFLELHLPAYCFPGGDCPVKPLLHDDDSAHASGAAAVVAEDTPSATFARPPAGEATCARREGDAVLGFGSSDSSTCSRGPATASIDGSQKIVPRRCSSAPLTMGSQQLRRGVVILDFGEGSAGQLASLCGRVRGGSACSQRPPSCSLTASPMHATLDGHRVNGRDRREGAGDHAEDAETYTSSPHAASAEDATEFEDDADVRLRQFVLDIVLVFISHAHADHHLGLMSLLTLRHEYLQRGPSALPPAPKLLIVCPTEVYAFMMDAWGSTPPYTTWLHEECVFDLMPPSFSGLRREGRWPDALAAEEGDAAPHGRQEKLQAATAVADNNVPDSADGTERDQDAVGDGGVDSRRAASFTHRFRHDRHALHASNNQPEQQHVVPMPLLQAHLTMWNQAIAVGIRHHQRQPPSDSPLPSSSEPLAGTSMKAAAASVKGNIWWDAEVITVDHPANAHALLLRFPFCSLMKEQGMHGVCGEAAEDGGPRTANPDAAEAATGRQRSQEPLSRVPDSSRVLLFSGDTRPSSFLVERSWAFATSAPSRLPRCADYTELTIQDGVVPDEADSGSALEGGRAALVAKANASGSMDRIREAALPRLPTSTSPSSLSSPVFILLHEATFGPGFEGEAVRKKHSTLPEALRIGVAVRAEFIVLNHFSQRYPKLPGLSEEQLGGRSADLVCQRRTRASAAVAATSAVTAAETQNPADHVSGGLASASAPRSSSPGEQQGLAGKALSKALRQESGRSKWERDAEQTADASRPLPPPHIATDDAAASPYANMSFAFDLMFVSFSDMQRGLVPRLTPTLVRLLEEYDSWGSGTTQRMRSGGGGAGIDSNTSGAAAQRAAYDESALRRRRADPLCVVAAALVAASLSCADGQRLIHGPPRLSSTWRRGARRLPGPSAFLPASSAVAASLTAQCRGRGRVSATAAAATTPPLNAPLGDGANGSFSVVDPVVPASVLVNPSNTSSEPLRRRAVKSSDAAVTDARLRALGDTEAEAEPPAVTAAAHLNGFGKSANKPSTTPQPAGEADAAESVPAPSVTAVVAAEMPSPCRKRKSGTAKRGTRGRRAAADEVVTAGVTVVPSVAVNPNLASSLTAGAVEGEGGTPSVDPVRAAALPPAPQHLDATGRVVASDADAVEGRVSSGSRKRIARQARQKYVEEPANARSSGVVLDNDKDGSAADVDKDPDEISEDGGARPSGRPRRASSRTRSGKRLRAKAPTAAASTLVEDAIAASVAKAVAEGVESLEPKTDADGEGPVEAISSTAASRAPRNRERAGGKRMKKRLLAPAAVAAASAAVVAAPPPPMAAAADDGKTATTPRPADSFKRLFDTVDAAKGISSLALKKRLAAQIVRRRWQLQRGLTLSPQALLSTATPAADEAGVMATSAAAKADEGAAAVTAPKSSAPSPTSPRRRLLQGKKSASLEASASSPIAAAPLPEKPAQSDEAAVAGGAKSKSRITKKGGKRGGSAARKNSGHTVAMAAAASVAPVAEPTKAAEVEDPASDADREADVAAAMAAAVELVSKPEVIDDEFSLAPQACDDAAAHATPKSHSPSALAAGRASQQQELLQSAGVSKVAYGASGGSSANGSGNHVGSSGSSNGGKGGKGANSKDTLFFPDYRERVVQIFEQLTQINSALGERFKSQLYGRTVERFKRGDKVFQLLPPNLLPLPEEDPKKKAIIEALYKDDPAAQKKRVEEVERNRAKRSLVLSSDNLIPGLGTKLREKVIEILVTGGLEELHRQEAKPIIRAIRELTQVHGVGPRTAIDYFKKYGISTVAQLRDYAIKAGELDMSNKDSGKPSNLVVCADKSKFHLNDAQRLGLVYYEDMCHRIPHEEGRLHEAFMKLRMRKYLGKDYELVVCGSYRRQVESAGDIDVLITHKRSATEGGGRPLLPPSEVLGSFLAGLKADKYIEATLAQGPTKFMGLCRLRAMGTESVSAATGKGKTAKTNGKAPTKFRARRLDVRYVDSDSFPAAMLYFTGSKNFNVIMRSEAIKKHCVLNEYGLFRKPTRKQMQHYGVVQKNPDMSFHDMITRLARFDLSAIKDEENELASGSSAEAGGGASGATAAGSGASGDADGAASKKMAKIVERQRVKASTEREIFEALGMDYVPPKDRSV
ncbi:DNA polymerase beta palm family protein [Leishmania donovani]|uniref:ribonuclease Z n=1 Tax=Leishmania donovani TaxID=5661 RepID=A0A504Y430_LEIDO|nr:DNA polymerase beta palm family protein [Leishmania donovani]